MARSWNASPIAQKTPKRLAKWLFLGPDTLKTLALQCPYTNVSLADTGKLLGMTGKYQ